MVNLICFGGGQHKCAHEFGSIPWRVCVHGMFDISALTILVCIGVPQPMCAKITMYLAKQVKITVGHVKLQQQKQGIE